MYTKYSFAQFPLVCSRFNDAPSAKKPQHTSDPITHLPCALTTHGWASRSRPADVPRRWIRVAGFTLRLLYQVTGAYSPWNTSHTAPSPMCVFCALCMYIHICVIQCSIDQWVLCSFLHSLLLVAALSLKDRQFLPVSINQRRWIQISNAGVHPCIRI